MTILSGRAVQRWISRILIAALILTSPGFSCYQAFALVARGRPTEGRTAAKALPALPRTAVVGKIVAVPNAPGSVRIGKIATPKAAAQDALVSVVKALPALSAPAAAAGALKTGSGEGFEASEADRPAFVAAPEPGQAPYSSLAPRPARSLGLARSQGVSAPRKTSGQVSSWKQTLVSSLPKLSVVAAMAGLGWIAHALGKPELLAGLLPAFMMGTLSGNGGSPMDPTSAQVLKELPGRVKPGETISERAQRDIAGKLGLTQEQVESSLLTLVEYNKLALVGEGIYLYTEVSQRKEAGSTNPTLATGHAWALKGLGHLNRGNIYDHALSVDALFKAMKQYAAFHEQTRLNAPAFDDVSTLYYNARLELLRGIFKGYDQGLSRREEGVAEEEEREISRKALAWLKNAYHDVTGHRPALLDPEVAQWMHDALRAIKPAAETKENAAEINHGMFLVQTFLKGEAFKDKASLRRPISGRRVLVPQSGGGEGKEDKWFDLIGENDKGYEALNEFADNMSGLAVDGKYPPYIGRQSEIDNIAVVFGRKERNNPVIVADSGVGKTSMAEEFVRRAANGEYPELKDVNFFSLDLGKVVAGTKYRGEFEQRLKNILKEIEDSNGRAVLFIDEIHTMVGAGDAEGAQDAFMLISKALNSGKLRLFGTTTREKWRTVIEKTDGLERRLGPVPLKTPTVEEAAEIVKGKLSHYEKAHDITIPPSLAKDVVEFAERYFPTKNLPGSAFDLLDQTGSRMKLANSRAKAAGKNARTEMGFGDLAAEVTLLKGVKAGAVKENEAEKLRTMYETIRKAVIGQDEVLYKICEAVIRARLNLKDPKKPIGVFILMGPTGVGKTETARALARFLFDSEENLITIEMQNYSEKFSQSGLIGTTAGYIGYGDAGQLTEKIRQNPYSVVLLDEMEKAHPDIYNLLLKAFDDGVMTDAQGNKVSVKHVLFIGTTNLGSRSGKEEKPMTVIRGPGSAPEDNEKSSTIDRAQREARYLDAAYQFFKKEFIGRVGLQNFLVYNDLDRDHLTKVLDIQIERYNKTRLAPEPNHMEVSLTEKAKAFLLDQATTKKNSELGARPLEQTIDTYLGNAIAKAMLDKTAPIGPGDRLLADYDPGSDNLVVTKQP